MVRYRKAFMDIVQLAVLVAIGTVVLWRVRHESLARLVVSSAVFMTLAAAVRLYRAWSDQRDEQQRARSGND